MPSLLPGFEYDIFVSYRHKDNKGDRWVTEFVEALRTELESTFKDDISIYFDVNPHDGLLESHLVDRSLQGKLKCLVFIPIISQTYCDAKSFAWQHEFCAFNRLAKEDSFGREIKLSNGNVASRILPVKIHDLDAEDKALLEGELGGMLRPIEFIYKEAGVIRPLKSTDNRSDNLNKTDFRNQVNKVANAIKEIITSLKNPVAHTSGKPVSVSAAPTPKVPTHKKRLIALAAGVVLLLALLGYFLFPRFVPADQASSDNSIAVLYFDNISSDPEQDYFSDGITEEITAHLSSIKGLRVTSRTSVIPFKGKGKAINIRDIAKQLNVTNVLEGSVRKAGDKLRITAQLIDARTDQHIWTEVYDRDLTDVFKVQSEIAHSIANKFKIIISKETNAKIATPPTTNVKAYELYLKARSIPIVSGDGIGTYRGSLKRVVELLKQAIALDPDYVQPYVLLSGYHRLWNYDSAVLLAKEAIIRNPRLADGYIALANTQDFQNSLKWFRKACELDSIQGMIGLANAYTEHAELDKAIACYSRVVALDGNSVAAFSGKALVYYYMGLVDSTDKYVALATAIEPNTKAIQILLQDRAVFKGQVSKADEIGRKLFGDDTLSYFKSMGIACMVARDWNKAKVYYAKSGYRDLDWGLVLMNTGQRDSGISVLKKSLALASVDRWPGDVSRIHAVLGNKDQAVIYFRKLLETGWRCMDWLRIDPFWDFVRKDPEFKKIVDEIERKNVEMLQKIKAQK